MELRAGWAGVTDSDCRCDTIGMQFGNYVVVMLDGFLVDWTVAEGEEAWP
jgi:hypothetical protein